MIEVFRTNVCCQNEALQIVEHLQKKLLNTKINFDLEDCDKILRIAGTSAAKNKYIVGYLQELGYDCVTLDEDQDIIPTFKQLKHFSKRS